CKDKVSKPLQYSGYSSPEYTGYDVERQYVTMSDGVKLATVWYVPNGGPSGGPFPVIFVYYPYHYDVVNPGTREIEPGFREAMEFYVSYGYVLVVTDMRGSGASTGIRVQASKQLADDGKEVVDWIAEQPWCNGNVGMMGSSYMGLSQYLVAGQKPKALKCIMSGFSLFEGYSRVGQYPGGIWQTGGFFNAVGGPTYFDRNVYWPHIPHPLGKPATPVIDEDGDGELIDEIPLDMDGDGSFVEDYELPGNPPQYEDGEERDHIYFKLTKEHLYNPVFIGGPLRFRDEPMILESEDTFDKYAGRDYVIGIAESGIPVYHTAGWFDRHVTAASHWYATLEKTNPSRLIIAPVIHGWLGVIAEPRGPYIEYFGENVAELEHGFNVERLRFFDFYLKGIENGINTEPGVNIFVMNGDGWRTENEWPLARQIMTDVYFDEGNSLAIERSSEGSDDYQADFTHDARSGSNNASRWKGYVKDIRMRTEEDAQCLTYTMKEPLKRDVEVTGHPIVHLWASSTADHGDFFVFLEDVDEDGNSYFVTEGQLRAGFAKLVPNEDMLPLDIISQDPPDVLPDLPWHGYRKSDYVDGIFADSNVVELTFDLFATSWVFKKGHRIRISIACADWPSFVLHPKLSPNNDPDDPDNIIPTVTVHRNILHPSHIELPLIPKKEMKDHRALKWIRKHF
ncbi:MAG: CocE/NonD family hydrolase, partial [Desulfobacteraceae bacterium]|nr:CocE/NonD family hydrolase [Desulfobacteraceae bacterium]